MHSSRLHVVLIDSPPTDSAAAVAFWGAALGHRPEPEGDTPFTVLAPLGSGQILAHQRLDEGPPRMHLDIETDDTSAEVARLETLGATRLSEHDGCIQMHDPAGLVFCVVPVQSEDFAQHATAWP
jgi:hypothetical protein